MVAVEDPIDMTSPQGRAFAVMLAVFGEMEAEAIRARVRAARAQILKDGRWPGGGIPYGYQSVPNPNGPGRVLAQDQERIGWLAGAVAKALSGETVNAIAAWLTDSEAPLPARRTERTSGSGSWNRQTVDGLLRNPVLAGMTPHNPGRAKSAKRVDPFAVLLDERGQPVISRALAIITTEEFATLQRLLAARTVPQARKKAERQSTSAFLSRVARCDECAVYLCRGTNQKRPVLYCPKCRQTIGRTALDAYLIERLLIERADQLVGDLDVAEAWARAGHDDMARRAVLVSQLDRLAIRRGVVGRYFDEERVLLTWSSCRQHPRA
ncbi:recombinase family protein [Propioniciclava flava]|uniref:recombinase family protein n=1 Tax=Propioniciclava flava TaxID=2072026 RepID=UPI0025462340|nr:recombinase family protein [Propioniciclava flava]